MCTQAAALCKCLLGSMLVFPEYPCANLALIACFLSERLALMMLMMPVVQATDPSNSQEAFRIIKAFPQAMP